MCSALMMAGWKWDADSAQSRVIRTMEMTFRSTDLAKMLKAHERIRWILTARLEACSMCAASASPSLVLMTVATWNLPRDRSCLRSMATYKWRFSWNRTGWRFLNRGRRWALSIGWASSTGSLMTWSTSQQLWWSHPVETLKSCASLQESMSGLKNNSLPARKKSKIACLSKMTVTEPKPCRS